VAPSRGGEQIDDVLDGLVRAVVGGFESAVWAMLRVRTVVEAAAIPQNNHPNALAARERYFEGMRMAPSDMGRVTIGYCVLDDGVLTMTDGEGKPWRPS
jgi:hypothetical protein